MWPHPLYTSVYTVFIEVRGLTTVGPYSTVHCAVKASFSSLHEVSVFLHWLCFGRYWTPAENPGSNKIRRTRAFFLDLPCFTRLPALMLRLTIGYMLPMFRLDRILRWTTLSRADSAQIYFNTEELNHRESDLLQDVRRSSSGPCFTKPLAIVTFLSLKGVNVR